MGQAPPKHRRQWRNDVQATQPLTLADAVFPRIESDNRALVYARELALIAGFAALMALLAQIQLRTPWSTVPITGQTFGALIAGGALGMKRGVASMALYAVLGMFLLPVFTPANSNVSGAWDLHFILPWKGNEDYLWQVTSGGYIAGFILAAGVVGFLAERGWDRGARAQLTMLLGTAIIYIPGLLWLNYLIVTDWVAPGATKPVSELIAGAGNLDKTLVGGLYPFIVGDLMKLLAAAMLLPGAWALVEKFRGQNEPQ
jgi:biotin transport system substrate-specific component